MFIVGALTSAAYRPSVASKKVGRQLRNFALLRIHYDFDRPRIHLADLIVAKLVRARKEGLALTAETSKGVIIGMFEV